MKRAGGMKPFHGAPPSPFAEQEDHLPLDSSRAGEPHVSLDTWSLVRSWFGPTLDDALPREGHPCCSWESQFGQLRTMQEVQGDGSPHLLGSPA